MNGVQVSLTFKTEGVTMPYSVLVIDDDPMLTKMLDTTLSEQDFEVAIAHTGHKARRRS